MLKKQRENSNKLHAVLILIMQALIPGWREPIAAWKKASNTHEVYKERALPTFSHMYWMGQNVMECSKNNRKKEVYSQLKSYA